MYNSNRSKEKKMKRIIKIEEKRNMYIMKRAKYGREEMRRKGRIRRKR